MRSFSLLLLIGILSPGCAPPDSISAGGSPDREIVSRLEEIVALEERAVKEQQFLAELGENDAIDQVNAEIALSEAVIRLAEEQNDREKVSRELEAIVSRTKSILAREEALAEEDRARETDLNNVRVALLEAEIRLRRHQARE